MPTLGCVAMLSRSAVAVLPFQVPEVSGQAGSPPLAASRPKPIVKISMFWALAAVAAALANAQ